MKTIEEATQFLRTGIVKPGGCKCPACKQKVTLRKCGINKNMVDFLLNLAIVSKALIIDTPESIYYLDAKPKDKDYTSLAYWGLIESGDSRGYWKITSLGIEFLKGKAAIQQNAMIYNREVFGYSGDKLTVTDVLDKAWTLQQAINRKHSR